MKKLVLFIAILFALSTSTNSQWYTITTPYNHNFNAVYFVDKNTGWICADSGLILHTTNRGTDWNLQESGTNKKLLDIKFVSSKIGWAIGLSGLILYTDNAGVSWNVQESGIINTLYSISSIDSQYCWISGNQGIILHTYNGGAIWSMQNFHVSLNLTSIYFIDQNKGWIGGYSYDSVFGAMAGIWRTENSGITWELQLMRGGVINEISFINENNGWVSGLGDYILLTDDAGINWSNKPIPETICTYKNFQISPAVGWVTSYLQWDKIHFTSDGGNSWTIQNQSETGYRDMYFIEKKFGWVVGSNGLILHTDNGGGVFPSTPLLISPENNQQLISDTVNLVWSSATPQITGYEVYLSTDSLFSNTIDTLITDTTIIFTNLEINTKYYWKVKAKNEIGSGDESVILSFKTSVTDVEETKILPIAFSLYQNYPNPFNPSTKISWQSPVSSWQTLKVYDILGNEIATLVNEEKPAGNFEVEFSVGASRRLALTSGIYFYQLKAGNFIETKKMTLLK